jgi:hypothetical protein
VVGIVERFDPKGVTDKCEAFFSRVPDGKGEHSVETRQAGGSIFCPRLKEDFRVGLGAKSGSASFEVAAKFQVVVDFSVKDKVPTTIGGGHGLGAARKIQNTESTVAKPDSGVGVSSVCIRAPVG